MRVERKLHWRYQQKLDRLLDSDIPDSCRYKRKSCATFRQVIDEIAAGGKRKVYISGGVIRDMIAGADISSADVDIKYSQVSKSELMNIFDRLGVASTVSAGKGFTYFFVGCDIDVQLEGMMITEPATMESPANSMYVDIADMTLHDPTGFGVEDAKKRVWRIPPDADRDKWFDRPRGPQLLWRMMKFRLRGFKVPAEDVRFIYKKFAFMQKSGAVKPAEYRNVINQVDPVAMLEMMIRDSFDHDLKEEVILITSRLLGGDEVWKRVEDRGNVPYQELCVKLRQEAIKRREKNRKRLTKR